ncbi:MAG TPA: beta-ketoacyl-ACP synthase I [Gammaproteobacteria bacterium]|nr:beta-ketoacyl-ACP synthase I [Gammaproteobacteria bacterium]
MKRVVITGIGIVSSIGNNKEAVNKALFNGSSGVKFSSEFAEMGFRSHVYAPVDIDLKALIDRKLYRFMGDAAGYAYVAMKEAIEDAALNESHISNIRTGLITGSGGASTENTVIAADTMREKGIRRVGPYMVTKTMGSTTSACLCTAYKIKGTSYSISSACATSAHCIGNAYELIQMGKQDMMFAGGAEELHWTQAVLFDGMGALSSKYNAAPETASRPYDVTRDGFVIAGGGGILVLEELEHAKQRGAKIYAELVGYGATSDGYDMVQPSGEGAVRCMQLAMADIKVPIDYINAHGTSTPVGDTKELEAIKTVFPDTVPTISSTKSLTGHALGAAGVNEAIYSLLMQQNNFVSASANIKTLDPLAEGLPIASSRLENIELNTIMSNSFGFGGTNASLVFQKYDDT